MSLIITQGQIATNMTAMAGNLTASQLELLSAPAMGVEMNLVLAGDEGTQTGKLLSERLEPAAANLFEKAGYGDKERESHITYTDIRYLIVGAFSSRFNKALHNATAAVKHLRPETVVNEFVRQRYDAVPFNALIAAGFVTHGAVSSYLREVFNAANTVLGTERIEINLAGIKNAREKNIVCHLGMVMGLVLAVGGITVFGTVIFGSRDFEAAVLPLSFFFGGNILIMAFTGLSVRTSKKSAQYKADIQNATTALVALQRQRDLLD